MKTEYVIENALLDAIGEINAQWIEQAADYEATKKIIPFPYKYAVVAANLFLCVICAVAFSLTKLNKNTDPTDLDVIFGTGTEEPDPIISGTEEPIYKTEKPKETKKPEAGTKTEVPEKTKGPEVTQVPVVTMKPTAPSDNVVRPDDSVEQNPVTPTKAPSYNTTPPTSGTMTPPPSVTVTPPPMTRVEMPKRPVISDLYEESLKPETPVPSTPSPTSVPVVTQSPRPTESIEPTAIPPYSTNYPEAPEPVPTETFMPAPNTPTPEPPLTDQKDDVLNKKYWFTWLNRFNFNGGDYVFDSMIYKGYEVFFATNESNIGGSISAVEIYAPDNPAQRVPGMVYELKGIDPAYAVAVRYDGYEEYIIAVRVNYNPDAVSKNRLQKLINYWL